MINPCMRFYGYYWLVPGGRPDWCSLSADSILSIDDSFGRKFPDLTGCFWTNYPKRVREEYREYLRLTETEFSELCRLTEKLFYAGRLSEYSCFRDIDAAMSLVHFLSNADCHRLVGIFTDMTGFPGAENCSDDVFSRSDSAVFLGCEILGNFDNNGNSMYLCSYLCNSLNETLEKQANLRTDRETGLIVNTYEETKSFARYIQGMGEPVIWTPFEVYEYYQKGNCL